MAFNTGKTSHVIDPASRSARSDLDTLIGGADLLLVGGPGNDPYGAGERAADWAERYPSLVVTQLTAFGAFGPRASWTSSMLVQYASSLWMHVTGRPDREPLAPGGTTAESIPGLGAASASLMALWWRDQAGGTGQVVDVSAHEVMLLCQPYLEVGYDYTGTSRKRNGMPFPMTIVPAADGYLGVNVLTQTQWELLCTYMGRPELIDDEGLRRCPPPGPTRPRANGSGCRVGCGQGAQSRLPGRAVLAYPAWLCPAPGRDPTNGPARSEGVFCCGRPGWHGHRLSHPSVPGRRRAVRRQAGAQLG